MHKYEESSARLSSLAKPGRSTAKISAEAFTEMVFRPNGAFMTARASHASIAGNPSSELNKAVDQHTIAAGASESVLDRMPVKYHYHKYRGELMRLATTLNKPLNS